jgi:hypothetical protein
MAITYEPVATTTLSSAAATITFSSIPATWTDLRLVFNNTGASATGVGTPTMRFNSDTASNYSVVRLAGQGTTAAATYDSSQTVMNLASYTAPQTSVPLLITVDLFSYAGSTLKTCFITYSNDYNGGGSIEHATGLYRSTSAITSISITSAGASTWSVGTTAALYGIKAA